VLLSSRAPVGYTAISMTPVAVNQGFIAIPPNGGPSAEYVLFWLRENMDAIRAHAGGTTFAEISKRAFRPLPMLVPPPDEIAAFGQLARPMVDQIASLDRERGSLAAVRDTLLPKLISGQIRVPADAFEDAPAT
jgi:type I restriction enzyme, S subunit